MKKLITFTFILFSCLLLSSINVNAASSHFSYISTSLGADATKMGISYQTDLDGSYVNYSTSSTLANPTKVTPTTTVWSQSVINLNNEETGFPDERNVCRANLENLTVDTTYYYQVVCGSEKSDIYSFKTASDTIFTSFAWITDSQTYLSAYPKIDLLLNNLKNNDKDISFTLITGDIIDQGGEKSQWDGFFNNVNNLTKMPFATIPGNHELYWESTSYRDASIYNQFFNNPQNGPQSRLNSSYYFTYNNILFIMLDTIITTDNDVNEEQKAWVKEVCANNSAAFTIVGMHCGCYGAGTYAAAGNAMGAIWRSTFEEVGADLVLSGHEHLIAYTEPLYKGKVDTINGVTYMIGPAAGNKTYPVSAPDKFAYTKNVNWAGSIISVMGNELTVKVFDQAGNPILSSDEELKLTSRKDPAPSFNERKFINGLKVTFDADNKQANLEWDRNIFGQVKSIKVINTKIDGDLGITMPINNSIIRSFSLGNAFETNNYYYKVIVTKTDDTTFEEERILINDQELYDEENKPEPTPPAASNTCNFGIYYVTSAILSLGVLLVVKRRK